MANLSIGRKSGFIQRSGRMRRETVWAASLAVQVNLAAAGTSVLWSVSSAAILALRPFTVIRSRGVWLLRTDQIAANERQQVAVASVVVTDEAVAAGIASIPTPATNPSSDSFFVYSVGFNAFDIATAVGVEFNSGRFVTWDSKAMRKVEDGFDFVSVVETYSTSSGCQVDLQERVLLKLH